MGLKTTNYEVKKLGIVLPEAYAMVKDLVVNGNSGYANIIVQSSRKNANAVIEGRMQPLEEVRVDFIVNRDENDRATAYSVAKSQRVERKFDHEAKNYRKVMVDMPFYGWEDDILDGGESNENGIHLPQES